MLKRAWQALRGRRTDRYPLTRAAAPRRRLALEVLEDRCVPATLFVSTTGVDVPGAGSLAVPFRSIQAAVDVATNFDTILVAGGTYFYNPAADQVGPRSGIFAVTNVQDKTLTLLGGWSNDFLVQNPIANPSIIDGQGVRRGVFLAHRLAGQLGVRMEGFEIRNGRATGEAALPAPNNVDAYGGGMWIDAAGAATAPTYVVRDVTFRNNRAIGATLNSAIGGAGSGGALALRVVPNLILDRVAFIGNDAIGGGGTTRGGSTHGGAFHIFQSNVTGSGLTFVNNRAIAGSSNGGGEVGNERADGLGGAVAAQVNSSVTFSSVTANGNLALGGNAGGNAGNGFGGAFFGEVNVGWNFNGANIRDNVARGGDGANGGIGGGGAFTTSGITLNVDRAEIIANHAIGGKGSSSAGAVGGGGMYLIRFTGSAQVSVLNSVIADNDAVLGQNVTGNGGGGGVWIQGADVTFTHTTIARNAIDNNLFFGRGVLIFPSSVGTFNHSIIAEHTNGNSSQAALHVRSGGVANLNRVLFAGNTKDDNTNNFPEAAGTFNGLNTVIKSANPQFASPGSPGFDYRLRSNSPAINNAIGSNIPIDLDLNARSAPDLGAFEFVTPAPLARDSIGGFDPASGRWLLRRSNSAGAPDAGNFLYGGPGVQPIVGDWDGNGTVTPGVFDVNTGRWLLRNSNSSGGPDISFFFSGPGVIPVVGDWDGNGTDTIGAFDMRNGFWFLRNSNSAGGPDAAVLQYGGPGVLPLVGDWNGDGRDTVGIFDTTIATFFLRDALFAGAPSYPAFAFGGPGVIPIAGDWNNDRRDSIGIFDRNIGKFFLRNSLSSGFYDAGGFVFGGPGIVPLAGDWDGFSAQQAADGMGPGGQEPLADADLRSLVDAATKIVAGLGADAELIGRLRTVQIQIAALGGDQLGVASAADNVILIDDDAAGHGWFVDATPFEDEEFDGAGRALSGEAAGRVDLLSVVLHEMGHLAGWDDLDPFANPDHLMAGTIPVGVRRAAIDAVFAG